MYQVTIIRTAQELAWVNPPYIPGWKSTISFYSTCGQIKAALCTTWTCGSKSLAQNNLPHIPDITLIEDAIVKNSNSYK